MWVGVGGIGGSVGGGGGVVVAGRGLVGREEEGGGWAAEVYEVVGEAGGVHVDVGCGGVFGLRMGVSGYDASGAGLELFAYHFCGLELGAMLSSRLIRYQMLC